MKIFDNSMEGLKALFSDIATVNSKGSVLHKFKRKDMIFNQGDDAFSFLFIISGKVSIVRQHNGDDFVVSSLGKGSVVGDMGLFVSDKTRTTSIVVADDVEALVIGYDDFMNYVETDYRPLFYLTTVMANRLHSTTRHADSVATMNVKDRLINLLSEMSKDSIADVNIDGSVSFKMSRKEMSLRIGCSRELAGKYLKELKDEGIVDYYGMSIKVLPNMSS